MHILLNDVRFQNESKNWNVSRQASSVQSVATLHQNVPLTVSTTVTYTHGGVTPVTMDTEVYTVTSPVLLTVYMDVTNVLVSVTDAKLVSKENNVMKLVPRTVGHVTRITVNVIRVVLDTGEITATRNVNRTVRFVTKSQESVINVNLVM